MCSIQLSVTMVASGGTWTMGIQRCTEFKVCHMRAAIRESGLKRLFIPSLRPLEGKNPLQYPGFFIHRHELWCVVGGDSYRKTLAWIWQDVQQHVAL
jgi:hypothetical protein